jgi:hypothetical protein
MHAGARTTARQEGTFMEKEIADRQSGSMGNRETERTDNERMRAGMGRGRDASGRPDETGIRSGEPEIQPSDADTDDGQPSEQTSSAQDMAGQI